MQAQRLLEDPELDFQGLDVARTLVKQRWDHRPGKARVPGYAVITGYEQILFVPVETLPGRSDKALLHLARKADVFVGVLSTDVAILAPPLTPGSYSVTWKRLPAGDSLAFHSLDGHAPIELLVPPLELGPEADPGTIELRRTLVSDVLDFSTFLPLRTGREETGMHLAFDLTLEHGTIDEYWN